MVPYSMHSSYDREVSMTLPDYLMDRILLNFINLIKDTLKIYWGHHFNRVHWRKGVNRTKFQ